MKELSYNLFFKAISNNTRFEIIKLLRIKPYNVSQISKKLNFEQSRVSHSLKCLEKCGFVIPKQNKKERVYSLNEYIKPILSAIDKHLTKYNAELEKCGIVKGGECCD
jgi:predicted transcriptional regulator